MIKQLQPTISVNTIAFFKKNEDYLKLKWISAIIWFARFDIKQ